MLKYGRMHVLSSLSALIFIQRLLKYAKVLKTELLSFVLKDSLGEVPSFHEDESTFRQKKSNIKWDFKVTFKTVIIYSTQSSEFSHK